MSDFETVCDALNWAQYAGEDLGHDAIAALDRIKAENARLQRLVKETSTEASELIVRVDELEAEVERLRAAMAFLDQCTCVCAYVRRARQSLEGEAK